MEPATSVTVYRYHGVKVLRLVKQLRGTGTSTISKTSTCTAMLTCRRVGRPMTIACQQSAALIFTGEPRPRPHDEDDESRRFASCLAGGACVSIYVHRAFAEGECACRRNSTRSRSPWRSQRWRWWWHVQRWQQWQGKWWGKGGTPGAGKGQGGGNSPAGWPSTTGNPSGGGRSNNPPKSK